MLWKTYAYKTQLLPVYTQVRPSSFSVFLPAAQMTSSLNPEQNIVPSLGTMATKQRCLDTKRVTLSTLMHIHDFIDRKHTPFTLRVRLRALKLRGFPSPARLVRSGYCRREGALHFRISRLLMEHLGNFVSLFHRRWFLRLSGTPMNCALILLLCTAVFS